MLAPRILKMFGSVIFLSVSLPAELPGPVDHLQHAREPCATRATSCSLFWRGVFHPVLCRMGRHRRRELDAQPMVCCPDSRLEGLSNFDHDHIVPSCFPHESCVLTLLGRDDKAARCVEQLDKCLRTLPRVCQEYSWWKSVIRHDSEAGKCLRTQPPVP